MAAASTLAVVRASEPCSAGSLTSTRLGGAHGERRAQAGDLVVGRHRDEAHLAAAGGVDELQRHLDAVAVGLVEDQLAVALERVGAGIQRARRRPGRGSASRRRRRSWAPLCTDRSRADPTRRTVGPLSQPTPGRYRRIVLADPARRQLVRLVGHRPQHGRRPAGAVGATHDVDDRRDQPPRPRHPLRAGRRHPRRRRGHRLRRRRHAERGRRPASPAPTPRSACCPGGSTNVFARTLGLPNDPVGGGRRCSPTASATRRHPPRSGSGAVNGRYFCFHTGVGFDAAVVRARSSGAPRSSAGPATRCSSTPALKTWLRRLRPPPPALPVVRLAATATTSCADGYFTIVLNTNPYTYLGNRPLDLSPAADARPRPRRRHVPHDAGDRDPAARSAARCAAAG